MEGASFRLNEWGEEAEEEEEEEEEGRDGCAVAREAEGSDR